MIPMQEAELADHRDSIDIVKMEGNLGHLQQEDQSRSSRCVDKVKLNKKCPVCTRGFQSQTDTDKCLENVSEAHPGVGEPPSSKSILLCILVCS